jgi:hypothetical protein
MILRYTVREPETLLATKYAVSETVGTVDATVPARSADQFVLVPHIAKFAPRQ